MSNHRLLVTTAAVGALLASSVGVASASQTLTTCHKNNSPIYSAKVCVNVKATNVGSGKWKIEGVTATVSERKFNGNGGTLYYRLDVYDTEKNALAFTNINRSQDVTGSKNTYKFDLEGLDTYPDPLPEGFWTMFTGNVSVEFEYDHPGFYNRKPLGEAKQKLG